MYHEGYGGYGFCGLRDARPHFHHRHDCFPRHHHGHGLRRFFTREERIAHLEEYLKQLQAEIQGVEEYLAELRKCQ